MSHEEPGSWMQPAGSTPQVLSVEKALEVVQKLPSTATAIVNVLNTLIRTGRLILVQHPDGHLEYQAVPDADDD